MALIVIGTPTRKLAPVADKAGPSPAPVRFDSNRSRMKSVVRLASATVGLVNAETVA